MNEDLHQLVVEPVETWAARSAELLGRAVETAVTRHGRCLLALSGGGTPGPVLEALSTLPLPWDQVVLLQVDERLVPADHPDRNLADHRRIFEGLPVTWMPLPVDRILDGAPNLADDDRLDGAAVADNPVVAEALADFGARLVELADEPPTVDVVQLGLGDDGHTASLFTGDPATDELRRYAVVTDVHQGHRRLTLTRPVFDRARLVLWLATGLSKSGPLGRLLAGDLTIPAGLVRPRQSVIVVDTDAARQY